MLVRQKRGFGGENKSSVVYLLINLAGMSMLLSQRFRCDVVIDPGVAD
jgi:hypothetical protein